MDKIKKFKDELRKQIKEVAEKLNVGGEAPSPAAILAMLGYQMYLDEFYLDHSKVCEIINYLMCGHKMAEEDEANNFKFFIN